MTGSAAGAMSGSRQGKAPRRRARSRSPVRRSTPPTTASRDCSTPCRSARPSPAAPIQTIDTARARQMPGVRAVFKSGDLGTIVAITPDFTDASVHGRGAAAARRRRRALLRPVRGAGGRRHVRAGEGGRRRGRRDLRSRDGPTSTTHLIAETTKVASERGDADAAFAQAPVTIDVTYEIATETHNPIETHATVAVPGGDDADPLRDVARRREPSQRGGATMLGLPRGQGARDQPVHRLRVRQQAVSLDRSRRSRQRQRMALGRRSSWSSAGR